MSPTATVTGLAIVPSSAQIHTSTLGAQYQFTLAATFSDGSTGFLTGSATWTSSNRSVATVAAGLATSTGYGTTTITASVGGQSATASLIVAEPALTSITVAPSTVTVYQGTAIQLTATGEYTDGSSVDVTSTYMEFVQHLHRHRQHKRSRQAWVSVLPPSVPLTALPAQLR